MSQRDYRASRCVYVCVCVDWSMILFYTFSYIASDTRAVSLYGREKFVSRRKFLRIPATSRSYRRFYSTFANWLRIASQLAASVYSATTRQNVIMTVALFFVCTINNNRTRRRALLTSHGILIVVSGGYRFLD